MTRGARPGDHGLWIFGYGSLVWRPAFPRETSRAAWVRGWRRRFWQGSTDHRGVPGAPGRVVTLVPERSDRVCWGMAYRIAPEDAPAVLAVLDEREQGGYERLEVELHFPGDLAAGIRGLMYVATEANPSYLGPAPLDAIARQVISSHGPSGSNPEYVVRLADALRRICPSLDAGIEDTLALAALVAGSSRTARPAGLDS